MKKYVMLCCAMFIGMFSNICAKNCDNAMMLKFLQDILNNSNIILPKTIDIQEKISNLTCNDAAVLSVLDIIQSLVEDITISTSDVLVLSRLDTIQSLIDDVLTCCDANGSQLDVIESKVDGISVSTSDELVLSQLDVIESKVDDIETCCATNGSQLDVIESKLDDCCASTSEVIGTLTDIGSCLDSTIDVPTDINNLQLTIISLLKTILLDLRGCNIS